MSKNVVVLGIQWGDEGKGKIVDLLTDRCRAVVRFQGGHNAGHTLVIELSRLSILYQLGIIILLVVKNMYLNLVVKFSIHRMG